MRAKAGPGQIDSDREATRSCSLLKRPIRFTHRLATPPEETTRADPRVPSRLDGGTGEDVESDPFRFLSDGGRSRRARSFRRLSVTRPDPTPARSPTPPDLRRSGSYSVPSACPIPPDGRQNGSGRSVTPAWFGIPPPLGSVVAPDHLLLLLGVAPGVGLHRSTVVEDADDVSVHPHGDELAREDPPHPVPSPGEEDPAVAVHLAQVASGERLPDQVGGLFGALQDRLGPLQDPQPEPFSRCSLAEGLVGPEGVVLLYVSVESLLGLLDGGEGVLGEELVAKGLVKALHLPGGGGRADPGEDVGDPVLPADPIEQRLPLE